MKLSYLVCAVLLIPFALAMLNPWLGRWACTYLGWHRAPTNRGFDGASFTGVCPRCGKHVLLDSQGNWF